MTCKDCIHDGVCWTKYELLTEREWGEEQECCEEQSRYIELPCKVGQTVYVLLKKPDNEYGYKDGVNEIIVRHIRIRTDGIFVSDFWGFIDWKFGERAFLTREEAEKALAERSENDG